MSVSQRPADKLDMERHKIMSGDMRTGLTAIVQRDRRTKAINGVVVMVGAPDRPGMRLKDGQAAKVDRRNLRQIVADVFNVPLKLVTAASWYTVNGPRVLAEMGGA